MHVLYNRFGGKWFDAEPTLLPTYDKFIEPTKYDADIVINNNTKFDNGLAILTAFLKTKL